MYFPTPFFFLWKARRVLGAIPDDVLNFVAGSSCSKIALLSHQQQVPFQKRNRGRNIKEISRVGKNAASPRPTAMAQPGRKAPRAAAVRSELPLSPGPPSPTKDGLGLETAALGQGSAAPTSRSPPYRGSRGTSPRTFQPPHGSFHSATLRGQRRRRRRRRRRQRGLPTDSSPASLAGGGSLPARRFGSNQSNRLEP